MLHLCPAFDALLGPVACRVWDLDMEMMCRRTLAGHKVGVLPCPAAAVLCLGTTGGGGGGGCCAVCAW